MKGCCGVKLFAGSSTGKLLVAKEEDIEKVISNSDRVVSIHSEDEEILNLRKKFIKEVMFIHTRNGEIMNVLCLLREEL